MRGLGSSFFCQKIMLDLCSYIRYNKITVKETNLISQAGKSRKGEQMDEEMTNIEFMTVLKLIIQILKDDGVKEETVKKIEALLK